MLLLVTVRAQDVDVPVRVQVSDDGTYRAFTGKMDMGQGSRTLLAQAFAEELGVPVERVTLVMGDTRLCPDDGGTWASITTPLTVPVIRKAAAAVRAARAVDAGRPRAPEAWRTLGQSVPNVTGLRSSRAPRCIPPIDACPGFGMPRSSAARTTRPR